MPTFKAGYEDWEDEQSEHFNVDARNILEAWHKAWSYIDSLRYGGSLGAIYDQEGNTYFSEFIEQYVADSKRFILLSGPSGVGKTPLRKSAEKEVEFKRAILYTSRKPRKYPNKPEKNEIDGVDYHFRTAEFIKSLKGNPHYIVGQVRNMWQAIDLEDLDFSESNLVYVEAYHTLGAQLRENMYLPSDVIPISVFMSPLSAKKITDLPRTDLEAYIIELTREKLKVRTKSRGKPYDILSPKEKEDIEIKAKDTPSELRSAHRYDYVLINEDGEGHQNWENLSGDAGRAVEAFTRILKFGIYRPHISIEESPDGKLRIDSISADPSKEKMIEYWTPDTI